MRELSRQASNPTLTLCGGTQMTKELVRDVPFVIGSAGGSQFRIRHPSVAERHATLRWDGVQTKIAADSDWHRVRVNGTIELYSVKLKDGDTLRIGDFEFLFHDPAGEEKAGGPNPSTVKFRGAATDEVPLSHGLTIGAGTEADVRLDDDALLPIHAAIEQGSEGFAVVDKGGPGLLVNGRLFERHLLLIGDRLDVGSRHGFVFDGLALHLRPHGTGCGLTAQRVTVSAGERILLSDAGFAAKPGEFVGIIGAAGSGKTTLLHALAEPLRGMKGAVFLNRTNRGDVEQSGRWIGCVPREATVHMELTGRQSLRFAASLRLPATTPALEIAKLTGHLAERLGIADQLDKRARELSASQLRRLCIAAELIGLPPVLLLDDPAEGLDAGEERDLLRLLRELTDTGCTVVCTSRSTAGIPLLDSIEVLASGDGEPGTTVFRGRPSKLGTHFGVEDLSGLHSKIGERPPSEWRKEFEHQRGQSAAAPQFSAETVHPPTRPKLIGGPAFSTLLRRQSALLAAAPARLLSVFTPPLAAGLAISFAVPRGHSHDMNRMLLACAAALAMAAWNAAADTAREWHITRRERAAGVPFGAWLGAKSVWLLSAALIQAALLAGTMRVAGSFAFTALQILALGGAGIFGTAAGTAAAALHMQRPKRRR